VPACCYLQFSALTTEFFHVNARFVAIQKSSQSQIAEMGCPALGVSVAFLKQPVLPGEAPQTKKILKKF
jgi:hypothetical protein